MSTETDSTLRVVVDRAGTVVGCQFRDRLPVLEGSPPSFTKWQDFPAVAAEDIQWMPLTPTKTRDPSQLAIKASSLASSVIKLASDPEDVKNLLFAGYTDEELKKAAPLMDGLYEQLKELRFPSSDTLAAMQVTTHVLKRALYIFKEDNPSNQTPPADPTPIASTTPATAEPIASDFAGYTKFNLVGVQARLKTFLKNLSESDAKSTLSVVQAELDIQAALRVLNHVCSTLED